MHRIFGGNPLIVLLRLAIISLIVGVVLAKLQITPQTLFTDVRDLVIRTWRLGFSAFHWAGQYLLLGAIVVLPIWIIVRIFSGLGRKA